MTDETVPPTAAPPHDEDQHDEGQHDAAGTAPAAPRRGLRALLGGTVGLALWSLVTVGLLVAGVVLGLRLQDQREQEQLRRQALQAARQSALNLTGVDQTDPQADIDLVLEGATGTFRDEFEAQAERLRDLVTQNRVTATPTVLDAALVRFDEDSATALVVVDSTVSNVDAPDGAVRTYRVQLDLERVGDRWLTSTLQLVA